MTRIIRRLAFGGLLALAAAFPPLPASAAGGLGLFGPRATTYLSPIETIYAVPTATSYLVPTASSYVVPTTSIVSTSYLMPTSSVVYRPARYTLAPTIYRPTSAVIGGVFPSSYVVGSSFLRPTRYYLGDVVSTAYYPTSFVYPSSSVVYPSRVVYDAPVIDPTPMYVDRPAVQSSPTGSARTQGQPEPPFERNRQSGNPPGTGRGSQLESRAIDPRPESPEPQPSPREIESESPPPPDLPSPDDGSIEGIMPLPEPFEMRQSQRPAFAGGLPGSTLATATRLVQGRVRDERGGQPVGGVVVTFSNAVSSLVRERQAITDARGEFRLDEFLPDGDWSIVVSGSGDGSPTRTYPQVTVMGGRIYDRLGRDYSKLVLDY